jgi:hypothetical protein
LNCSVDLLHSGPTRPLVQLDLWSNISTVRNGIDQLVRSQSLHSRHLNRVFLDHDALDRKIWGIGDRINTALLLLHSKLWKEFSIMPRNNRALRAPITITPKQLVQSYGDWVIDHLNYPQQTDLLTYLAQRMSRSPHWTKKQARKWVNEYYDLEWTPYFMTFMFRQIPGSIEEKLRQMHKGISRFYGTLASRVVRSPRSPKWAHLLPRGVFYPDGPCYTGRKSELSKVKINDGLHFHGIILVPNQSRLKVPFLQHLRDKKRSYGRGDILMIHAEPNRDHHRFVADYAGKAVKRGRTAYDDVLVLPRTGAELSRKPSESLSGPDREIKDIMSANNLSIETARGFCRTTTKSRDKSTRR